VEAHHVGALGAQFRATHVLDAHHGAVLVDAQRDVGKLLGRLEQVLHDDGGIEVLARHGRGAAELAGGNLDVVGVERRDDVAHGQVEAVELVRVEPDTHGVLGSKVFHFADPGTRDSTFSKVDWA
jgi:hypothetical protein